MLFNDLIVHNKGYKERIMTEEYRSFIDDGHLVAYLRDFGHCSVRTSIVINSIGTLFYVSSGIAYQRCRITRVINKMNYIHIQWTGNQ